MRSFMLYFIFLYFMCGLGTVGSGGEDKEVSRPGEPGLAIGFAERSSLCSPPVRGNIFREDRAEAINSTAIYLTGGEYDDTTANGVKFDVISFTVRDGGKGEEEGHAMKCHKGAFDYREEKWILVRRIIYERADMRHVFELRTVFRWIRTSRF